MIYLVTGGAGFIGSHIVEELLRRGQHVRVLDNFSTGKRENLDSAVTLAERGQKTEDGAQSSVLSRLEVIEGDIRDMVVVGKATQGVHYVLHQAALPSVQRSVLDPMASNDVNVTGTLNLLVAARDAKVKRFVFASSSSVYGNTPTLPKDESMQTQPLSPYAVSKLAAERYCIAFRQVYDMPTVCIRYFNVFGPRQDPTSHYSAVIPKFITSMLRGEPPTIYGDGLQSRDFTYVANVVNANLLACERDEAIGHAMNVACGERYTLLDLHRDLISMTGTSVAPTFGDARPGDVKHSMAAIGLAASKLGYQPIVSWMEGLKRTVEWYSGGG
ncbi:MAG: SDR family oxidoreductase [Ignavibacteriae bacterium]|nr:SDR family oxidoreductase [Ignavibacteriota bacterium]